MCPLNEEYWPDLPADKHRLALYVPREMWRWWEFDNPADRRRCEGVVTRVTTDLKLKILYQDDGTEDVAEETFLKIVKIMKKEIAKKKQQKKRRR
jgi:hypothetical protein